MARHHLPRSLRAPSVVGLAALLPLLGCNSLGLLDVTNPDIILTVHSASGALALRNGVVLRLAEVTAGIRGNGPDNLFIYGGLLADEYRSGDTFVQRNDMDQRRWDPTNTFLAGPFRDLNRVRVSGASAIDALRTYAPTPASNIGLMFAFIAFADNLAGEYYCNGIPLSSVVGTTIVYGDPIAYDSLFGLAIAEADSAVASAPATDSVSARARQLAWIVKGRALLNQRRPERDLEPQHEHQALHGRRYGGQRRPALCQRQRSPRAARDGGTGVRQCLPDHLQPRGHLGTVQRCFHRDRD